MQKVQKQQRARDSKLYKFCGTFSSPFLSF
jgi:hypothetical protein